ncbi:hypothetical protein BJ508DRAFT_328672 [Ascobolus immersus RN42]|uniref:Cora-domain-containing protein n=1 Tax=Ascobolus immersus RN42 TaxID=1160509 RepID=A0A3N4HZ09_ASCIM|nr:hypothetical protein BJ508DRAFT_328672 [Ascobolus immersus RN42]
MERHITRLMQEMVALLHADRKSDISPEKADSFVDTEVFEEKKAYDWKSPFGRLEYMLDWDTDYDALTGDVQRSLPESSDSNRENFNSTAHVDIPAEVSIFSLPVGIKELNRQICREFGRRDLKPPAHVRNSHSQLTSRSPVNALKLSAAPISDDIDMRLILSLPLWLARKFTLRFKSGIRKRVSDLCSEIFSGRESEFGVEEEGICRTKLIGTPGSEKCVKRFRTAMNLLSKKSVSSQNTESVISTAPDDDTAQGLMRWTSFILGFFFASGSEGRDCATALLYKMTVDRIKVAVKDLHCQTDKETTTSFIDQAERFLTELKTSLSFINHSRRRREDVPTNNTRGLPKSSYGTSHFYVLPAAFLDLFLVLTEYLLLIEVILTDKSLHHSTASIVRDIHLNQSPEFSQPEQHPPSIDSKSLSADEHDSGQVRVQSRNNEHVSQSTLGDEDLDWASDLETAPQLELHRLEKLDQATESMDKLEKRMKYLIAKGWDEFIKMERYAYGEYADHRDSPNSESILLKITQNLLERNYESHKFCSDKALTDISRHASSALNRRELYQIRYLQDCSITTDLVLGHQRKVLKCCLFSADWTPCRIDDRYKNLLCDTATARMNHALTRRAIATVDFQLRENKDSCALLGQQAKRIQQIVELRKETSETATLVFTVVTTIFLPATFVAGYFGMNTMDIRDTDATVERFWIVTSITLAVFLVITLPFAFRWRSMSTWLWDQYNKPRWAPMRWVRNKMEGSEEREKTKEE